MLLAPLALLSMHGTMMLTLVLLKSNGISPILSDILSNPFVTGSLLVEVCDELVGPECYCD